MLGLYPCMLAPPARKGPTLQSTTSFDVIGNDAPIFPLNSLIASNYKTEFDQIRSGSHSDSFPSTFPKRDSSAFETCMATQPPRLSWPLQRETDEDVERGKRV
mmetsp:Transcript_2850/g.5899  ORF Transcript_2850/g.5899 Transcript_2850/m.5899 type:complete len:103 (-) Transcript_2850:181-489(-)